MNKIKKNNICVVGAGPWGRNHIKTLHNLNALGAVVETDIQTVSKLKSDYSYCKYYDNVTEALDDDYDGFIVATPPSSHFTITKKIIEEGKPVLVEKPITLNLEDAVALNKLAKQKKVNLMVGHLLLFHPAFIKINKLLKAGDLGDIQYIYSNRLNLGTFRTDENVFWSFAPHDISLINHFFNEAPLKITSRGIDVLQKNIHDTTITSFKYNNNKMGHIFVSWLHPFKEHRFVIVGSEGMIHFDDSLGNKPLLFYDKKVEFNGLIPTAKSGDIRKIKYPNELPLTNELIYFMSKINNGKIEIANGDSAVEVVKILEIATNSLLRD